MTSFRLVLGSSLLGAGSYLAILGAATVNFCRTGAIHDIVEGGDEEELAKTAKLMASTGLAMAGCGLALVRERPAA